MLNLFLFGIIAFTCFRSFLLIFMCPLCDDIHGVFYLLVMQINLAQETLRGLLSHWITKRRQRSGSQIFNGDGIPGRDIPSRNISHARIDADDSTENHHLVLPAFEFSTVSPPSIITEDSQGCSWRKKITELDGSLDEKDIPWWCLDCVLNGRLISKENTKYVPLLHSSAVNLKLIFPFK